MRRAPLRIAVVDGREPCPIAEDLATGLAARGHAARLYRGEPDVDRLMRRLRADAPDVVSDHAGDAAVFAALQELASLHTLHVPPRGRLAEACLGSRAWFATHSELLALAWRDAGLERVQVLPAALAEFRRVPAVVRPVALVADRRGAAAALRAGLGIAMLRERTPRDELGRGLAHAAVYIAGASGGFDFLAAQAQLAGCPVVGDAGTPLAELVEKGVSGLLVAPGDAPALAAAARRAAALDRHAVRASARRRLALEPMLARYESELRAIARRSAVRLVA